jgi:hypothetical protein
LRSRFLQRQANRILIAVLAIFVSVIVVGLVLITDASNRVNGAIGNFQRVLATVNQQSSATISLSDLERLESSLNELDATLNGVNSRIGFLRPVSQLDTNLNFGFDSLDSIQYLVKAANQILDGLQPTVLFLAGNQDDTALLGEISSGQRIAELLELGQTNFANARDNLHAAQAILDGVSTQELSRSSLLNLTQLEGYIAELERVNELLVLSPDLITRVLGINSERSYLILAQNNDEIRPSGGYISTYGWMTVRDGRITAYDYQATTSTTPNPPSSALAGEIQIPEWWIQYRNPISAAWDGSWSADFSETAERAMWYYNNGNNPQAPVDGVISIDITAFERILSALGQVNVDGYDRTVSAVNFRDVIYDIRAFGEGTAPHKRFLVALYKQIFEDWLVSGSDDGQQSAALIGVLLESLQQKNLMLYFADPQLQGAMDLLGWSGQQTVPEQSDYLMVVDANMGNKSNASVARQITYDVSLFEDGSREARLSINYDYSESRASSDPAVDAEYHGPLDYSSILQIFVPQLSRVDDDNGFSRSVRSYEYAGATLFTSLIRVPYNSAPRFQLNYHTEQIAQFVNDSWHYRLLIQKQPGMRDEYVNILLTFPDRTTIISTSPQPIVTYQLERQIAEFRLQLRYDEVVEVVYNIE